MKTTALLLSVVLLAACSSSAQQPKLPAPDDVIATVGSRKVTIAEVDRTALEQQATAFGSMKLSQALYEARRAALEQLVGEMLIDDEAKARGVDRARLINDEITSKVTPVTDAEVTAWYQANQARVQGATLDQVRGPVKGYLEQQRAETVRRAFIDRLKAKTPVRVTLDPPRQRVDAANRPARGPAAAPVEIIEFSDFQCPYCFRATPTIRQVLAAYGDKIRLVYRHYPLPGHPQARPAAEASECAAEQGKFWEYHDRLFADQAKLSPADLKQDANAIGLDATKFDACVESRKYKGTVDADIQAADAAGVSGTPAFFVNGRLLSGALPFESFKRVIDEELELKAQR